MPVKLNGSTSGSVTLDVPAAAGTNTLTLPARTGNVITSADTATVTQAMLASGVAGNGPAFYAHRSADQTGVSSNVATKINLNATLFNVGNAFDNTTNFRYQPQVAGYYQISFNVFISGATGNLQFYSATIYKNGAAYSVGSGYNANLSNQITLGGSSLVYLNGSSDYIELYTFAVTTAGTITCAGGAVNSYMAGFLARAA